MRPFKIWAVGWNAASATCKTFPLLTVDHGNIAQSWQYVVHKGLLILRGCAWLRRASTRPWTQHSSVWGCSGLSISSRLLHAGDGRRCLHLQMFAALMWMTGRSRQRGQPRGGHKLSRGIKMTRRVVMEFWQVLKWEVAQSLFPLSFHSLSSPPLQRSPG